MTLPAPAHKLPGISPRAYQHPADRAATAALQKVPYLDEVVRKLIALGYERALRAASLGASVRLGQGQLPGIWVLHRECFNALDVEPVPDLYLTQFPLANAATIGTDRPVVILNSELVRLLGDEGRRVVLAHEAAHVHSGHVLYQTALVILVRLGQSSRLPLLAGLPLKAIELALLEWFRGAELSCDRAAALVTRDPLAVSRTLMTIAAGEAASDLSLDAFIAQAMDYDAGGSGVDRMTRMIQDLRLTHRCPCAGCASCSTGYAPATTTASWAATTCAAGRSRRCARRPTRRRSTMPGACRTPSPRPARRSRTWASSSATG